MANNVRSITHQAELGPSGEDYLEAVLVVSRRPGPVRVTALARQLGVSKPSVVSALAGLEARGLVRHERYGGVELTVRGRRVAREVDRRHRLLCVFLTEVLGVSPRVAEQDACRLEHHLSPETVARLLSFVQRGQRRRWH
ncbi:MAG: metal-dependent transcriptional regulator [candidate division WOR-3 bacterium]